MFVLDQAIGSFLRVRTGLKMPEEGAIYSVNEANASSFPEGYQRYLQNAHANGYSSRYIGSMVADVHRTLIRGGVFLYPPTSKNPTGKLRLLYEANPMAMLIEQAGGKALAGRTDDGSEQRILALEPEDIHERCAVILGSPAEVDHVSRHL